MGVMTLEGKVEIRARDIFAVDGVEVDPQKGFEDCYQGTERTPILFQGKIDGNLLDANLFCKGGMTFAALELIMKRSLNLRDNKPVKVKISIESDILPEKSQILIL
ncbi:MAG: hypothetical protein WC514_02565 [Candidatus Paceibacterota bacterium]